MFALSEKHGSAEMGLTWNAPDHEVIVHFRCPGAHHSVSNQFYEELGQITRKPVVRRGACKIGEKVRHGVSSGVPQPGGVVTG
jgi:hypothetical protein